MNCASRFATTARVFAPEYTPRLMSIDNERGFGIMIMRRLMDGVQFDDNGTCVRLYRRRALT